MNALQMQLHTCNHLSHILLSDSSSENKHAHVYIYIYIHTHTHHRLIYTSPSINSSQRHTHHMLTHQMHTFLSVSTYEHAHIPVSHQVHKHKHSPRLRASRTYLSACLDNIHIHFSHFFHTKIPLSHKYTNMIHIYEHQARTFPSVSTTSIFTFSHFFKSANALCARDNSCRSASLAALFLSEFWSFSSSTL
jgi:hypothetical protein